LGIAPIFPSLILLMSSLGNKLENMTNNNFQHMLRKCVLIFFAPVFFLSSVRTLFVMEFLIFSIVELCCRVSLLILSGRSSESTTPLRKRRYGGTISIFSSVIKTLFMYNFTRHLRSG
jgi:hypothetical protein